MYVSLDDLILKTSAMEAAEFSLKSQVEFFTDTIRGSKIHDCSYNRNCGTFVCIQSLHHSFIQL